MWNIRARVACYITVCLERITQSKVGITRFNRLSRVTILQFTYTWVDHFRREQDLTEQTMIRIQSGISSQASSKSKYVQLSRRLAAIIPTYGKRDLKNYLHTVSRRG